MTSFLYGLVWTSRRRPAGKRERAACSSVHGYTHQWDGASNPYDGLTGDAIEFYRVVRAARANLVVRDGFASFYFHSFLDLEYLERTIERIEAAGYKFASPASLGAKTGVPVGHRDAHR
jgi:hypothetical protein